MTNLTAVKNIALVAVISAMAACTAPQPGAEFNDPYEDTNRAVHGFNKGLDRALVRPAGKAYGAILPDPVEQGVSNFAQNAGSPGDVVNNVLQGDVGGAFTNTFRFVINTTVGIVGLVDVAKAIGLEAEETDFGETLHVWGADEGAYIEMPFFGPSTERDAAGTIVDLFLNPLSYVLPSPESSYATFAKAGDLVGQRDRFASTIDSILYESADSYAQSRSLYLQNRRFELGGDNDALFEDIYEDPYDE